MNVLSIIYKGLVKRGRCSLNDIPEECREETKALLENQDSINKIIEDTIEPIIDEESNKIGAVNIPNLNGYSIPVSKMLTDGKSTLKIPYNEIFVKDLFSQAYPKDVKYIIRRIENNYMRFNDDLKVSIDTIDDDCIITFEGTPKYETNEGFVMLRIDIDIKSSNYDNMHFTLYLYAD